MDAGIRMPPEVTARTCGPFSARPTAIDGLFLIEMKEARDERGTIREFYRESTFVEAGLPSLGPWLQVNITESKRGAIRGLHGEDMFKLVAIVAGEAFGAYVDTRPDSPSRGRRRDHPAREGHAGAGAARRLQRIPVGEPRARRSISTPSTTSGRRACRAPPCTRSTRRSASSGRCPVDARRPRAALGQGRAGSRRSPRFCAIPLRDPTWNTVVMADTPAPDIDLLDGAFYVGDPHPTYTWMRANAPVYFDAAHNVWGLASYAAVLGASKDPVDVLERGRHPSRLGPDPDDDRHGRSRALEAAQAREPRLHAAVACATARDYIRDECDAIIDRVCERGECDFVRDIAAPLPMILIGDMLGVEPEDRDDLLRWSDDMVSAQSGNATEEQFVGGDARDGGVHRVLHARGRAAPGAADRRPDERARARRGRRRPARARRRPARVAADPRRRRRDDAPRDQRRHGAAAAAPRPAAAARSTIRRRSRSRSRRCCAGSRPIKNMCRTVTHDTEFMGQQLLEGQKCMLLYESANRDETKFDDPFRFDVRAPAQRARRVRVRRALLPRPGARPARAAGDVRAAPRAPARPRARGRSRPTSRAGRPTSSAASSRCRCASRRRPPLNRSTL